MKSSIVTTTARHRTRISRMQLRATSPALAFLIVLLSGFVSGRAETTDVKASAYRVLYAFSGGSDGAQPMAALVRDSGGNLYGTTEVGGTFSVGTVFKVTPTGRETVLYNFSGKSDGGYPVAGLIDDALGNFYGTTSAGGVPCIASGIGCGVVFKVDSSGKETVLYRFTGGPDGAFPGGSLIRDNAGNLYGTAPQGGLAGGCGGIGCGVVFRIAPDGTEKVLYTFTGGADGGEPVAALIRDSAGNFYGTVGLGGIGPCGLGCGAVFKLDTSGNETVLYSFMDGPDGGVPVAGLIADSKGNLYGTTEYGGAADWGVVYKLDPTTGTETVLHSFTGGADGATPIAGLVSDSSGNLYGTTYQGGTGCAFFTCGVIFKLDTTGRGAVLHSFNGTDGSNPYDYGRLVSDSAGNLYGTTSWGGAFGYGVVFKLTP